jgi:iron complex transport system ATP-binding protein
MIVLQNIGKNYGARPILKGINLTFESGEHTVILGANGAGKSTLLRIAALGIEANDGQVFFGRKGESLSTKELAKRRAFLSQHYARDLSATVYDMVLLGRQPFYQHKPNKSDVNFTIQALERFDLMSLIHNPIHLLSGGELQRVHLARVYAQILGDVAAEKYFFMDEPSNNLDMKFQVELFGLVDELRAKGITVISVLHDINLALQSADKVVFLSDGKVQFEGAPVACNSNILEKIYQIPFEQQGHLNFRPVMQRAKSWQQDFQNVEQFIHL